VHDLAGAPVTALRRCPARTSRERQGTRLRPSKLHLMRRHTLISLLAVYPIDQIGDQPGRDCKSAWQTFPNAMQLLADAVIE